MDANTKRRLIRSGIVFAALALVLTSLFSAGISTGLISTDNSDVTQSSLISRFMSYTDQSGGYETMTFSKDDKIYVSFDQIGQFPGTVYEAKYYYLINLFGNDVGFLITTINYSPSPGDTTIYFQLNNPRVVGRYRVDIYRNQTLIARRSFSLK
jgi:hypothetical protein